MISRQKYSLLAGVALLLPLSSYAQPGPHSVPPPAPPVVEHPAIEDGTVAMLKATARRLAGVQSMAFTAVSTYEWQVRTGQPRIFTIQPEVMVQHPNKLRVLTPGGDPASDFCYDG